MSSSFRQLLMRWGILALGVILATRLVPGIHCDDLLTLLAVVLLLSLFNAILKPVLVLFTLPFILVTMGLGMVVINALLFLLAGRLVQGFYVAGFWSAVGGALVLSATHFIVSRLTRRPPPPPAPPAAGRRADDVIDI
ncbi:MAG TPA: phage holin family protein [Opitutaceae bacterium]|jgi:putative membrane protein|nr:phage holin family protein [Opitutaceae bacterium]